MADLYDYIPTPPVSARSYHPARTSPPLFESSRAESEPDIVEVKVELGTAHLFPTSPTPALVIDLQESVRALSQLDPPELALWSHGPVDFLKGYFTQRAGHKPTPIECDIARSILTIKNAPEELKRITREFYQSFWRDPGQHAATPL
jgi:hypothetical protein